MYLCERQQAFGDEAHLFRISVEVEIRHDLPWVFSGDGATHAQNFPGEHPPHQTH